VIDITLPEAWERMARVPHPALRADLQERASLDSTPQGLGEVTFNAFRAPAKTRRTRAASHEQLLSIALFASKSGMAWSSPRWHVKQLLWFLDLGQRSLTVRDHFLRPAWGLT